MNGIYQHIPKTDDRPEKKQRNPLVLTVPNIYARDPRMAQKEIAAEKQEIPQNAEVVDHAPAEQPTTDKQSSSLFPLPPTERPEFSDAKRQIARKLYANFFTNRPRKGL